ncbi:MAG: hotdog domain-containing protein [Verrucomicrobiales bacterium]
METPPRYLAEKVVMMPRDTNAHGTIFGGVILSHMDMAGSVGATMHARSQGWAEHLFVTVAMDGVQFLKPVFVGDVVSFWVSPVKVGRTSITMRVEVEADRRGSAEPLPLTHAEITYVAVESDGSGGHRTVPVCG